MTRLPALLLAVAAFAPAPALAQSGNDAPVTEIDEATLNAMLAPANVRVERVEDAQGNRLFRFGLDGVIVDVNPRDCSPGGVRCEGALMVARYVIPQEMTIPDLPGRVDAFNRKNFYMKAVLESPKLVAGYRYVTVAHGVHMGTMRSEVSLFVTSFRALVFEHIRSGL